MYTARELAVAIYYFWDIFKPYPSLHIPIPYSIQLHIPFQVHHVSPTIGQIVPCVVCTFLRKFTKFTKWRKRSGYEIICPDGSMWLLLLGSHTMEQNRNTGTTSTIWKTLMIYLLPHLLCMALLYTHCYKLDIGLVQPSYFYLIQSSHWVLHAPRHHFPLLP